jgi:hypothetical protein
VSDGDRGNRYRPQALVAAALSRLDSVGLEELGSERLHEFAEKQCLLANGTPPPILNPTRKLHDQNPIWVADSFDCRRAVENGYPQLLPFVVPIILHLRSLVDVAPRLTTPELGHRAVRPCHGVVYISNLTG